MMQRERTIPVFPLLLSLTSLALGACGTESPLATEARAGLEPAEAALPLLPLRLSVQDGITYPDPARATPCPDGRMPMVMEGTGTGTRVGSLRWTASVCSDGTTWIDGRGVIRSANGDEIHFSSSGEMTGPVHWTETGTIDGGTGRFLHVSGVIETQGVTYPQFDEGGQPMFPMKWTAEAEGTISYQASDREDRVNMAVMERWLELMNTADLTIADEIFASDFTAHIPNYPQVTDLESYKRDAASAAAIVRDFQVTLEDVFGRKDMVVGRFTATGEMPPAFLPYTNTWIIFFRFDDGKIAEEWWQFDLLGVQEQLGALPATRTTYTWGEASEVTGDGGHPEKNEILARRAEDMWNTGNLASADEVFAASFVNHDPVLPDVTDRESYEAFITAARTAFPDFRTHIDDVVASGDRVAVRRTVNGTHEGEFAGIPATGRMVEWTGTTIYRIADGKIVESWWSYDALGLMMQLMGG